MQAPSTGRNDTHTTSPADAKFALPQFRAWLSAYGQPDIRMERSGAVADRAGVYLDSQRLGSIVLVHYDTLRTYIANLALPRPLANTVGRKHHTRSPYSVELIVRYDGNAAPERIGSWKLIPFE